MKKNYYPKRDPIKDYFTLPNEIFYLDLSYGEIAVYAYLLHCENRKSFQCYPSYKTIGEALNMSRNTVCKYVRALEGKELITTEPTNVLTKKGEKLNGNLLYTILPIEQAKQHYYNQQLKNINRAIADSKHRKRIENLNLQSKKEAGERVLRAKTANIIYKQDKARGRQAAPSQITSDGRADRLGILSKKEPLKKRGL